MESSQRTIKGTANHPERILQVRGGRPTALSRWLLIGGWASQAVATNPALDRSN